ncbi:MAG: hypothetical protein WC708_00940 [Lentisphaeria bacterium]|jgi:hypothetical protein
MSNDFRLQVDAPEYEEAHGIRGLEYVLRYTIPSTWEFHTLNGYVPYSVWKDLSILIINANEVKFRRLKEKK